MRRGPSRLSRLRNQNEILIEKSDEALIKIKKPKSHREYGDLLAVKRFDILLNLRKQI